MYKRNALIELKIWAKRSGRKPLILRGARQVGKTTLVDMFSKEYSQYICLNLEKEDEKKIFKPEFSLDEIIEAMFFYKRKDLQDKKTLIFIDEIQNSAEAVKRLRYFHEEKPEMHVIAAGSLFDFHIGNHSDFPVGRVEYMVLRPFSFTEFLEAVGEAKSKEMLKRIPFPDYAHDILLKQFKSYCMIGGMPEVIKNYSENHDILETGRIYEGLIKSYIDDVEKYAPNNTYRQIISFIINNSWNQAGKRIRFEGFANSPYKSREMSESFKLLEKTMLLSLIFPITNTTLPLEPDFKKSPRLQMLDTGLVNYFAGLHGEFFESEYIDNVYEGRIAEHIACQELCALNTSVLFKPVYWLREKTDAKAEVDFIFPYKNYLIPVEVKSGATGKLRSLFEFVDRSPHPFAVRIYSGKVSVENIQTIKGKNFRLLNLPFYLISEIENYLNLLTGE